MKHLTIIASGITLISSYSFAMQYKPNFNNNLSNETIRIFDIEGREPCTLGNENPKCSIGPKETKALPITAYPTGTAVVITTRTMAGTSYMLQMKKPLPKNINFTHSTKPNWIDVLYDGKPYASFENKHRDWPGK
jgi:hypothetical protein